MLNRLILKVTKFQLPPPKRLGTVVKNILVGHHAPPPPPCQIGLKYTSDSLSRVKDLNLTPGNATLKASCNVLCTQDI